MGGKVVIRQWLWRYARWQPQYIQQYRAEPPTMCLFARVTNKQVRLNAFKLNAFKLVADNKAFSGFISRIVPEAISITHKSAKNASEFNFPFNQVQAWEYAKV